MSDVQVFKNGCIKLGRYVSCDGYHPNTETRVQTHFHQDHLWGMRKSKIGQKKIVCTQQTKHFLSMIYPDIPSRKNQFIGLPANGQFYSFDRYRIALHNTNHMPGSAMVEVVEDSGSKYAYTSDLSMNPISLPDRPNILVVDATHGDPMRAHNFSFDEASEALVKEVGEAFKSTHIVSLISHTSNLFRALRVLSDEYHFPFCVAPKMESVVEPFCDIESIEVDHFLFGSEQYHRKVRLGEPFFMLVSRKDNGMLYASQNTSRFHLWAGPASKQRPIEKKGSDYYCAFSEHADFETVIDTISRISPKRVIVDDSRSPVGSELARAVRERLRIDAATEARLNDPEFL